MDNDVAADASSSAHTGDSAADLILATGEKSGLLMKIGLWPKWPDFRKIGPASGRSNFWNRAVRFSGPIFFWEYRFFRNYRNP